MGHPWGQVSPDMAGETADPVARRAQQDSIGWR